MVILVLARLARPVVAARVADEHQGHQAGTDQHGQADAERGCDQHVNVDRRVALRDQDHRNGGDDDRQQRKQAEDPPEAAHRRMGRAWQGVGLRHCASLWSPEVGLSRRHSGDIRSRT